MTDQPKPTAPMPTLRPPTSEARKVAAPRAPTPRTAAPDHRPAKSVAETRRVSPAAAQKSPSEQRPAKKAAEARRAGDLPTRSTPKTDVPRGGEPGTPNTSQAAAPKDRDRPSGKQEIPRAPGPENRVKYVGTPAGVVFDIPAGWAGRETDNKKGIVFQRPGASGNGDSIRIMEPNARYNNGYARVYNSFGQPIGLDGKPGSQAATHVPADFKGVWAGYPKTS